MDNNDALNQQPGQQEFAIESKDILRRVILDWRGDVLMIGGSDERILAGSDGSTTVQKTDIRVMTRDGHVIDHEHGDTIHTCVVCMAGPYSKHAMSVCIVCRTLICPSCAAITPNGTFCAPCHQALTRAQFWKNLWCLD